MNSKKLFLVIFLTSVFCIFSFSFSSMPVSAATLTWCHTFTSYLITGSTDAATNGEVSQLKVALAKQGFNSNADATGVFGTATHSAVIQFQAKYGIAQTGTVGPITRTDLNYLYQCAPVAPVTTPTTPASTASQTHITVTSPNGGEKLTAGQNYTIKWNSQGVANVYIELMRQNTFQNWIIGSVPNTNSWVWTIPSTLPTASNYSIRVIDAATFISDDSDNYFTITTSVVCTPNWACGWTPCVNGEQAETAIDSNNCGVTTGQTITCPALARQCTTPSQPGIGSVTVIAPNGGETLTIGQTYRVKWTSQTIDNVYIYIDNYGGSSGSRTSTYITSNSSGGIVKIPASQGYYDWTPTTQQLSQMINADQSKYKIRIVDVNTSSTDAPIQDSSDNYFSIVASTSSGPGGGTGCGRNICTPSCDGKNCGDSDGCNGKCQGTCPLGQVCSSGQCVFSATGPSSCASGTSWCASKMTCIPELCTGQNCVPDKASCPCPQASLGNWLPSNDFVSGNYQTCTCPSGATLKSQSNVSGSSGVVYACVPNSSAPPSTCSTAGTQKYLCIGNWEQDCTGSGAMFDCTAGDAQCTYTETNMNAWCKVLIEGDTGVNCDSGLDPSRLGEDKCLNNAYYEECASGQNGHDWIVHKCQNGYKCNSGQCQYTPCNPACDGSKGYNCIGGQCVFTACTPRCTGSELQCGYSDGCGGFCSTCPSGMSCYQGQCAPIIGMPRPVNCTSFTYSDWSACSSSGTQTRTVLTSSPTCCMGGNPVLSQTCTPNCTPNCPSTGQCGATDGCGGICQTGTCATAGQTCVNGSCQAYQAIPVTSITVTGAGSVTTVAANSTLQMSAAVLPANATNKNTTWSVTNGTGTATISSTGLLTATTAGTVTVKASAQDGSGITGTEQITVVSASSSSPFIIISPTQNEILTSGTSYNIKWTSTGINNVDIYITRYTNSCSSNPSTCTPTKIASNIPASQGNYSWAIPSSLVPDYYKVQFNDTNTLMSFPPVEFQVVAPSVPGHFITIKSPAAINSNSGVDWYSGQTNIIKWTSTGINNVNISYTPEQWGGPYSPSWAPSGQPISIATNISALQQNYYWAIPASFNEDVAITITDANNPITSATSSTVVINSQPINSPDSNWSCANWGQCDANDRQQRVCTYIGSGPCHGALTSENFGNTADLPPGCTIVPTSDEPTITQTCGNGGLPFVVLKSPAAGATFVQGQTYNISWDAGNIVSSYVGSGIGGETSGCSYTLGVSGYPADYIPEGTMNISWNIPVSARSFSWTVPSTMNGYVTHNTAFSNLSLYVAATCPHSQTPTSNPLNPLYANDSISSINIVPPGGLISATSIAVTGANSATTVAANSTLQMAATVLPTTATNPTVTWSVANGTGSATISSTGLLTPITAGTVTVTATAADGSGITGTEQITVTAAPSVIPISAASITITSPISTTKWTVGRSNYIRWKETKVTYVNITLTNTATSVTTKIYSKVSASRGYYLWTLPRSLASGNYTITVSDSSNSATNSTSSSFQIVVKVSSVKVTAAGSATTIPVNATLHMSAAVLPANATNPAATWSVTSGTGTATIDPSTGLLTPLTPGTVTVKATAQDGGVIGTKHITIVGACTPNWLCGGWSKTYNGKQTRGCWDQNSCGTTLNEPPTSRNYCTDTVFSADCPAGWHCDGATNTCYGCGDGVCNLNYGETYSNCPTDCSNPVISNPGSCNANCSSQGGGYCQGTCPVGYKCAPTNPSVFTYNILYAGSCVAVQTPTPIPACVGEGQDVTTSYLGGNCCAGLVVSQGKCVNPLTSAQTGYWTYFIDSGDLWTKYGDFGNGPHTCIQLCKSKTLQCLENQCIVPGGIPMMAGGMYQDCSQSGSVSVYCCCSGS